MRGLLLILAAAAAASAVPAAAFPPAGSGAAARSSDGASSFVRVHRGHRDRDRDRDLDRDRDRDRDRRDRYRGGDVYLPYRDYQGDTLWRVGGFNDWWHDRPDRAFPRWVANNGDCERQYWVGGGWRC